MGTDVSVTRHVFRVASGDMHVFLIVLPDGITLIDAGFPGTMELIAETLQELGRWPEDIHNVLLTHSHPDHAAGLAEVEQATRAAAWMHGADAQMVREGKAFRPYKLAPGLRNWWFVNRVIKKGPDGYDPAAVDHEVVPGETIPVAGGIRAIWTPGHTAGHLVFLVAGRRRRTVRR